MIPNILWQSWKTKDIPRVIKPLTNSWQRSNPQLKTRFMDDAECSQFILDHFGKSVHELYLQLPQPIMRADFWRVAVVYTYGGYYSDLDIECNASLNSLVHNINVDCVFIKEFGNIANFFFGAEPNHPVLKNTLDQMIVNAQRVTNTRSQDFGMHPLHYNVRSYFNIINTDYKNNSEVCFLDNEKLKEKGKFIHIGASGFDQLGDYESWRHRENRMMEERKESSNILFFTTFNKNGYELYGKEWIKTFSALANYYNKFQAKIFYEGFKPPTELHPNIHWINYEDVITHHPEWKTEYLSKTQHSDYVRTMTVRFSHKAFVIQHVLDTESHDYLIWVDGDCVFKNADYQDFPTKLLGDKFLACQVEYNNDLNHVESGILIFNGNHPDTKRFNQEFKEHYRVENVLSMSQPYDGFLVFKSLLTSGVKYVDLNKGYSKGGIQSDPNMTFCHPEIHSKFIHNIGWTGKNQYKNWEQIYRRDNVYQKMNTMLFGNSTGEMLAKKKRAENKLQKLKMLKNDIR
jgi:hypothetical protein